ncbi:hepatocyte growth factor-regulated tyrosine kinase substrate isoform X5 [Octopus bimaculoides]|uniref:hepatocyte growth factor-regulated tyrosine kinase substrate isoform X5 n=1 Tax=Octopus bimaculoides TaxID=37653 RepID=UPI0022E75E87|nr:hepatocyte growth factor-regulated tyrosine kinase substrate isoform X5 [Octopus bimaculoides]
MFGRNSQYDKALEKATSQLLLEPDWDSILGICDCIRQGDVQPKYALTAIKKKLAVDNPHVAMFALQTLESCVKNCSSLIHQEVASKEFMEFLKEQVKTRPPPVKEKILELIQVWSHAFRNEPSYKAVQDTYHLMKMEGYTFPALKEADAMFVAEKAPEWKDGECCTRCRVGFSVVQRKHHCRNCGEVMCSKCSSKVSTIPRFGIEREVRVCDSCFDKLKDKKTASDTDSLPSEYLASSLSKQSQTVSAPAIDTSDMDPELARYLNRNYWQQRSEQSATTPSAPIATAEPKTTIMKTHEMNGDIDIDQQQFLGALQSSVEIFVNRMRSNSMRGRSITNDTSVQSLFNVISNMHPQLLKYIQEQEDARSHYECLQDKLAQLRDAREALDALREDHREKRRREQEEQERLRQIQMSQKLEIMRQKKHEYLEMQRQLAFQRMHEQEREYQIRLEQQKHLTQIRQMQAYGYGQNPYGAPNFPSPGSSLENSPVHQMHRIGYLPVGMMPGPGAPPGMAPPPPPPSLPVNSSAPNEIYMQPPGAPPSQQQPPPQQQQPPPSQQQQPPPQQQQQPTPPQIPNAPNSTNYSQPAGGQYPPALGHPSQTVAQSAGYQPAMSTDVIQASSNSYQSYNPASSQPSSLSQISSAGPIYTSIPNPEYSSLNMQNLANTLPPVGASQPSVYSAIPAQPPQQQPPQQQQPQQQQQYMAGPPTQQYQAPPQQMVLPQNEAELISFD